MSPVYLLSTGYISSKLDPTTPDLFQQTESTLIFLHSNLYIYIVVTDKMGLKPWVTFENAIQYTFIAFFGTIILSGT
jgi:hypothetical protein